MTLENISADHLRQVLEQVEEAAASERLMAAITYKEFDDVKQEDAAELDGYSEGWASKWFNRLERLETEPFKTVVSDEPREGRPTELSDEQHEQFVESPHDPPEEVGYEAPAWSVPLARHYLAEEFDGEYCECHVRRLMSEAGLSGRQPDRSFTNPTREPKKPGKKDSNKA